MKLIHISILLHLLFVNGRDHSLTHGDLAERIDDVSHLITIYPDSSALYFQRANLYYEHEEFENSLRDLALCLSASYNQLDSEILRSKNLYKLDRTLEALTAINSSLDTNPKHVVALRVKGQIESGIGDHCNAALCFNQVIELATEKLVHNYIEAASEWSKCLDERGIERALKILDEGITKLGPLVTLMYKKIDLYLNNGDYKNALEIQHIIISQSNRKETAYYEKSLIHLLEKDSIGAKVELINAIEHFNRLPLKLKKTEAMYALKNSINSLYSQL